MDGKKNARWGQDPGTTRELGGAVEGRRDGEEGGGCGCIDGGARRWKFGEVARSWAGSEVEVHAGGTLRHQGNWGWVRGGNRDQGC